MDIEQGKQHLSRHYAVKGERFDGWVSGRAVTHFVRKRKRKKKRKKPELYRLLWCGSM